MKSLAFALCLLVFFSGCISSSPANIVEGTDEYKNQVSKYGDDVHVYSVSLSEQDALNLSNYVSEIYPVESTLVFVSNKKITNQGYVFQVSEGNVILTLDYDYYAARSLAKYTQSYRLEDPNCLGASLSLYNYSYDGTDLTLNVKNTGNIAFDVLTLVIRSNEYMNQEYNPSLEPNEAFEIKYTGNNVIEFQVYPEDCPMVRLRGFV